MSGRNFADILQQKMIDEEDFVIEHNQCETVVKLKQIIVGNGSQGIADLVTAHEQFIQRMKGGFILIGFIGVSNFIGLIIIVVKLFSR